MPIRLLLDGSVDCAIGVRIYVHIFQTEGQTVLHIACSVGDEAAVKYLHSVKANPNVYDKVGLLHAVNATKIILSNYLNA